MQRYRTFKVKGTLLLAILEDIPISLMINKIKWSTVTAETLKHLEVIVLEIDYPIKLGKPLPNRPWSHSYLIFKE
jgi:hypothetical protein